jgi:pimeloyl-ACP methyl ester carboxylesterase
VTPRRTVSANGVELCLQEFGAASDPTLLLLSGAGTTMELWPSALCERLAAAGRHVVRYDFRDAGQSTLSGPGGPAYTLVDLADDAVALLDALDVSQAHLVGMSMGGEIAQIVALRHPERLDRLTLISTTPVVPADPDRGLPGMMAEDEAAFGTLVSPDWSDLEATVTYFVEGERRCAAKSVPFDETAMRASLRAAVERSPDPAAVENHYSLVGSVPGLPPLSTVPTPTVVLHGDEDPVFPVAHAEALAAEIPNSRLQVLRQVGHEMPARIWDQLVEAIIHHTGGPRPERG